MHTHGVQRTYDDVCPAAVLLSDAAAFAASDRIRATIPGSALVTASLTPSAASFAAAAAAAEGRLTEKKKKQSLSYRPRDIEVDAAAAFSKSGGCVYL